jgi:hypothetical protein
MPLFAKTFEHLLEAPEVLPTPEPVDATPEDDKAAMASTLDTAKPEDFDAKVAERQQQVDHVKNDQIVKLKEWVLKLDDFINFLNGTDESSLQSQLHSAPCDTTFELVARSEKKKITRLAADLSSLSEAFKGYLISYNDN